ncbi:MAG: C40 family peptidase [Methylococcaceae bacterium]|nr:C40 family peptidase [Methylococcaceae bacterium]
MHQNQPNMDFTQALKLVGVHDLIASWATNRCLVILLVFLSACAVDKPVRQGGHVHPFPGGTAAFQQTANPYRNLVLQEARAQLGKPYRRGGGSPGKGFDCSGLVFFTHRQAGLNVPRMSHAQLSEAQKVDLHAMQPGDLVFFRLDSNASHVGIYIGGNEFIHAPAPGKTVTRESLGSLYWRHRLIAAGNFYR